MCKLNKAIENIFASDTGSFIYEKIVETVEKENMLPFMEKGMVVGFSGGADSVFLICFLIEYQRRTGKKFNTLAVHVNHCIRGDEADRDERFSQDFLNELNIPFKSVRIDVPTISKKLGIGIEEAARNARYSVFNEIISSRNDIKTIVVAHNATDNTETVMMNILRGSGISGVCGIKPIRDNIIRPLIQIPKTLISSLLTENDISYVFDSTNLSVNYSRNYVRSVILPLFKPLSSDADASFSRMCENIRMDLDYLNEQADLFIKKHCAVGISAYKLRELHPSIFAKVLSKLIHENTNVYPEEKHISALRELIKSNNFCYSLPGEKNFVCQRGICTFVLKNAEKGISEQIFSLTMGDNKIEGTNLTVFIGDIDKTSLNVYKFSIQVTISSAIIDSGLILRFKSDGDAYRYSGITHKLKKVFNDRNIPPNQRSLIPIICDSEGIVVVPGMSIRDGAKSDISTENTTVTFAYSVPTDDETELFTALLRN